MSLYILSVDLQNEFAVEGGALYRPRPCVPFLRDTFLPFVRASGYPVAEIISDYRRAEASGGTSSCIPGQWGYGSLVPSDLKHPDVWVKAAPSPSWVREGGGEAEQRPGAPYPDPNALSAWLRETLGPPAADQTIILIGLMLEICVLSTLQELSYRGYRATVLFEGVDTYAGTAEQKQLLFETLFPFWGEGVTWRELEAASP